MSDGDLSRLFFSWCVWKRFLVFDPGTWSMFLFTLDILILCVFTSWFCLRPSFSSSLAYSFCVSSPLCAFRRHVLLPVFFLFPTSSLSIYFLFPHLLLLSRAGFLCLCFWVSRVSCFPPVLALTDPLPGIWITIHEFYRNKTQFHALVFITAGLELASS